MKTPRAQSYFKHRFLGRYLSEFAFRLSGASKNPILIVDGFAGPGRFEDGTAASAEMIVKLSQLRPEFNVRLIEKRRDYAESLRQLVGDAAKDNPGLRVMVLEGSASQHLPAVMEEGRDAHVFLYLDPCGYGLSFDELVALFVDRPVWPRTEMMLNFSADLVRRLGGANFKGQDDAQKLTAACGGDWWIDVARHVVDRDGNWSRALGLVMEELTKQLSSAIRRHVFTAPIRARPGHEPKFHMVCATSSGHGLFSLSHCFAFAWDDWASKLDGEHSAQDDLFGGVPGASAIRSGRDVAAAKQRLKEDVLRLPRGEYALDDSAKHFVGRVMGHLKEGEMRSAFKEMAKDGLLEFQNSKRLGHAKIQIA